MMIGPTVAQVYSQVVVFEFVFWESVGYMFKLLNGTAVDLLSHCVVETGWPALSGNGCGGRLAIWNKYGGLLLSLKLE